MGQAASLELLVASAASVCCQISTLFNGLRVYQFESRY